MVNGGATLKFRDPIPPESSIHPLVSHPVPIHDALNAPPGTSSSLDFESAVRDSFSNACGPNDMG